MSFVFDLGLPCTKELRRLRRLIVHGAVVVDWPEGRLPLEYFLFSPGSRKLCKKSLTVAWTKKSDSSYHNFYSDYKLIQSEHYN